MKKQLNGWVIFILSLVITLVLCLLIFFLLLKAPVASMFMRQGETALENGDYDTAEKRYALALFLKNDREDLYWGYANALVTAGNHDRAIEILDQGIQRISGAESLYRRKAQVYVEAGRIGAAVDFLDNIGNSYINKKLQSQRPADLSYSPTQGKYSSSQDVEFIVREDEKIYYTINGEDPTLSSAVYEEPIHLSGNATVIAIAVSEDGMVSPRLTLNYEIDNANEAIVFADPAVEQMVRATLNKPSGNLYAAQLVSITTLDSEQAEGEIRSLKDLELLPALNTLHLTDEFLIEDYSPLSHLPSLTTLSIINCALNDTALTQINACTQLTDLNISYNQITSLNFIDELIYLQSLDASNNEISSLSSIEYPSLMYLYLSHNWLSDLSGIETLQNLVTLDVSDNLISDLSPIAKLEELESLALRNNTPTNIKKLSVLKSLYTLDVSGCQLVSLSIVNNFPALINLTANNNQIASLSTFKKQVNDLYINENPLVDLSPLKQQKELYNLDASKTKVEDVSCLTALETLTNLDITDTPVKDATVLKDCPALSTLYCSATASTADLPESIHIVVF